MLVGFAGSLVTFYMGYEMMTLFSLPLVLHERTPEAVATFGKLRPIIRRRLAANCAPAKLDAFLNVRLFEK